MKIGIIGDGQLGRMLALSGYPLGVEFGFLGRENSPSASLGKVFNNIQDLEKFADVITYESENTSIDLVNNIKKPVYPSAKSLFISQHRGREKALFNQLNIPCAPYQEVNSVDELKSAVCVIGLPAILKTNTEGYDGKGQFLIRQTSQINKAWDSMNGAESILEGFINFKRELSLIAVRDNNNQHRYYSLAENTHHQGILRLTTAPAQNIDPQLQKTAEHYMQTLLDEMNHIGVLTIELFETNNGLVINEMAPRVHNSGHWSIEGAQTSQFENHVRAISNMPLGATTSTHAFCAMVNIIGKLNNTNAVLKAPNAHLHLYGKDERTGRKLGHITLNANTQTELNNSIQQLRSFLPTV